MPPRLLLALVALAAPAPASKAPDAGPAAAIDPCSDEGFKAASEALERAKAPADVKAALDRAIDLRSKDPALRARRLAQALASQAKGGPREQAEEDAAVLLEQDTHQPDAWGVLADRAEKAGQVELARALVARALFAAGKAPSASAWRARLGKRSSCTSAASRPDKGSSLSMVGGWVEAFKAIEELRMVHEEKPEPTTEAAARERVCVNNDLQEITERGVCKGAGPWTVQTGHMHFHDHMATLVPLDGKRMAVVQYITGDGCRGGSSSTATYLGGLVLVETELTGSLEASPGQCDDGAHDFGTGPCIQSHSVEATVYDARTGNALVVLSDREGSERWDLTREGKLHRSGVPGCDELLDPRKLPADLK